MKHNFKIGKREIGEGKPVFIIAEMSGNHGQSFEKAREIIKAAKEAGADAVKIQTFSPKEITLDSKEKWFKVAVNPSWKGKTLYKLYQENCTPWEWQAKLKKIAENLGIILFSTAYDSSSVDFLEKMNMPVYKVASFEIVDIEFLKKVAFTKKPVIISRGMASLEELNLAISTLRKNGAKEIAILHCVSSYPALPEEMNLATIPDINKRFKTVVGLSDHSLGISAAVASVALGAEIIEKHFTLSRKYKTPDSSFSLEPKEFKEMVKSVREVEKAIGRPFYGVGRKESENVVFRRSLFIVKDVKKGEKFTRENIRCIRPGHGLAPKLLPEILGRKAIKDIKKGTPLSNNLIL